MFWIQTQTALYCPIGINNIIYRGFDRIIFYLIREYMGKNHTSLTSSFITRLNPLITPPLEKSPIMTLTLQEVLIVGSCSEQVKFSELTLDMFRMLQTLEREPQEDMAQMYDQSPAPGRVPFVSIY